MNDVKYCPTYRWGQTGTHVIVTIDVNEECVHSHDVSPEGKVTVSGDVPKKGKFLLALDLNQRILAKDVTIQRLPRTLRLRIPKEEPGVKWKRLQKESIVRPAQEKVDLDFYMDSDSEIDSDDSDADVLPGADKNSSLKLVGGAATKRKLKEALKKGQQQMAMSKAKAEEAAPARPPRTLLLGPFPWPDTLDILVFCVALAHLCVAPYTKVEESFNLQAMHDLLFLREKLALYDHFAFPGVVPGSFLGAMVVALLAAPLSLLAQLLLLPKILSLFLVRGVLALLSVASLSAFRFQLERKCGPAVGAFFALLCGAQFHLLFYASRPLPNTFAACFVYVCFGYLLQERYATAFALLAFAGVVFRAELVLLYLPFFLQALLLGRLSSASRVVAASVGAAAAGLAMTVCVDSVMWDRWVWPEGMVLHFNTVLNQSSAWGASPWHWYLSSAIPRAMLGGLCYLPGGILWSARLRYFVLPVCGFLCLSSLLPHKELRCVMYGVPMLNAVAALELGRVFESREKAYAQGFYWRLAVLVLLVTFGASCGQLAVAAWSYPGATAMQRLHAMEEGWEGAGGAGRWVHVDAGAAEQGVSRFVEQPEPWRYSKREGAHDMSEYTHAISDREALPGFTEVLAVQQLNFRAFLDPANIKPLRTVMRVFKRDDLTAIQRGDAAGDTHAAGRYYDGDSYPAGRYHNE